MAVYKVPQDVEADDKLIGPFSFRQFIYLVIVAIAIFMAWFMAQIFVGLILIPLPFIIFFGALALPLRKDQPMEIYLAAVIQFYLKPRIRKWDAEGQVDLVTIVAPRVVEQSRTKEYGADEAQRRLSYLSQVIDTQGWAARGVTNTSLTSLADTVTAEASTIDDVMDESIGIGHQFDSLIEQQDAIRKQQMTQRFQAAIAQPATPVAADYSAFPLPIDPALTPTAQPDEMMLPAPQVAAAPTYNPYPSQMRQRVVEPASRHSVQPDPQATVQKTILNPSPLIPPSGYAEPPAPTPVAQPVENPQISASDNTPSPDIMRLANNNDLSISALAREAHRLQSNDDEVVVSLR